MANVTTRSGLVEQARQLAGRSVPVEDRPRTLSGPEGPLVPLAPPPTRPGPDGYLRQSPVQPLYARADRTRRLVRRVIVAVLVVLAAVCVGAILLTR